MSEHAPENRDTSLERQPYTCPTLREFGPVGKLTQAGTGMINENPNSMNPNARP